MTVATMRLSWASMSHATVSREVVSATWESTRIRFLAEAPANAPAVGANDGGGGGGGGGDAATFVVTATSAAVTPWINATLCLSCDMAAASNVKAIGATNAVCKFVRYSVICPGGLSGGGVAGGSVNPTVAAANAGGGEPAALPKAPSKVPVAKRIATPMPPRHKRVQTMAAQQIIPRVPRPWSSSPPLPLRGPPYRLMVRGSAPVVAPSDLGRPLRPE